LIHINFAGLKKLISRLEEVGGLLCAGRGAQIEITAFSVK